jgi:hypothetical protein
MSILASAPPVVRVFTQVVLVVCALLCCLLFLLCLVRDAEFLDIANELLAYRFFDSERIFGGETVVVGVGYLVGVLHDLVYKFIHLFPSVANGSLERRLDLLALATNGVLSAAVCVLLYIASNSPRLRIGDLALLAKVVDIRFGHADMLSNWLDKLESGAVIHCARDQVFSPIGVDDAVAAILGLVEGGHSRIFHVCGPRPVTRLQLLQMLIEEADNYRELRVLINPCSIRDPLFKFAEPRPFDLSMSPRKLYATLGRSCDDPARGMPKDRCGPRRQAVLASGRRPRKCTLGRQCSWTRLAFFVMQRLLTSRSKRLL